MVWPSQLERRTPRLVAMEWPSQRWDDPQFGKFTGIGGGADMATQTTRSPAPKAKKKKSKRTAAKPQAPRAPAGSPAEDVPSAAEVAALVQSQGLAGAVQTIRKRTGWDFQRAAQYLARAMRDQ
jgi:hypothetical protein